MKTPVKALILSGYGLNCDYETDYSLKLAGADSYKAHINELITDNNQNLQLTLGDYHILIFGGGFSWADDHGAGVILASKIKYSIGEQINRFIEKGKLIMGICNGFQTLVNMGLLPAFGRNYHERQVAVTYNDSGNFIDTWVNLKVNTKSSCVFTKGISHMELPVRHGEGKFYTSADNLKHLLQGNQVVMQYADDKGNIAGNQWPLNPNGSLLDIAGICDPTGRIFGLMPHPEAFNHYTNHPDWTKRKEELRRRDKDIMTNEGGGIRIFRNAVEFIRQEIDAGKIH